MATCATLALGQTQINLATQGRNIDFSNAPSTRPVKTGTALPATCSVGDLFFQTSAPQGQNLFGCPAINSWTLLGGVTSSGGTSWGSGLLAAIPATCKPGSAVYLYFATDEPAGQQEFQCTAPNVWTQIINIGASGALAVINGSLDIITSVVPRLPNANTFTGSNSFTGPVFQISARSSDPGCAVVGDIGKIWINNTSVTNTAYQVCLAASGTVGWMLK